LVVIKNAPCRSEKAEIRLGIYAVLYKNSNNCCRTSLKNALPVLLVIIVVVSCYFVYPSWKLLKLPPATVVIYASIYLLSFVFCLRIFTSLFLTDESDQRENLLTIENGNILGSCLLLIFMVLLGGFQMSYLSLPILSGPDEPIHISKKLWQWELYSSIPKRELFSFLGGHVALTFVLASIAIPFKTQNSSIIIKKIIRFMPVAAVFVLPVILYFVIYQGVQLPIELGTDKRWPPLGTILGVLSFSILGANEVAARFFPCVFYCGTGFIIFSFIKTDLGWKAGVVGLVVCLTSPLFFAYGHLDFRELGGVFFMLLGSYNLLLYVKRGQSRYLVYLVFAVIAGYFERRPAAILFFVAVLICLMYQFSEWVVKNKLFSRVLKSLLAQISFAVVVVYAVFPWVYITGNVRPYHFYRENFFQINILSAYLARFNEFFPWPILVLLCIGTVVTFCKRRWSGWIALLSFFALYILFTGDDPYWIPVERFAVFFMPFCAILLSQIYGLFKLDGWKESIFSLLVVFVCFSGLRAWALDTPGAGFLAEDTRTASKYPHYPFDDLLVSLEKHKVNKGKIMFPSYWQSAFPAYCRMYQMWGMKEIVPSWKPHGERGTTMEKIRKRCMDKNCHALVIPFEIGNGGAVKIKWVQDITYETIDENLVPGFKVLDVCQGKMLGLILLKPE